MQRIRWPKNYSAWNGSSDSESGSRSLSLNRPITGVYLFCTGDQYQPSLSPPSSPMSTATKPLVANTMGLATVPQTDAIFRTETLSLSALIGVPLLTRRLLAKPALSLPRNAHYDNASATALHLDPSAGYAPAEWSQGVGTVLVVRADQQPLTKEMLENIVKFAEMLAKLFGRENVEAYATPQAFAAFCAGEPLRQHGGQMGKSQMLGESWLDVGKHQVSV